MYLVQLFERLAAGLPVRLGLEPPISVNSTLFCCKKRNSNRPLDLDVWIVNELISATSTLLIQIGVDLWKIRNDMIQFKGVRAGQAGIKGR